MGFYGFISYIGILYSVLFQPIYLAYIITMSLFLIVFGWFLALFVGRPFDTLHCSYLGHGLPPSGRLTCLVDFCSYGFRPGLAPPYDQSGLGDCKGPYTLIR